MKGTFAAVVSYAASVVFVALVACFTFCCRNMSRCIFAFIKLETAEKIKSRQDFILTNSCTESLIVITKSLFPNFGGIHPTFYFKRKLYYN